MLRAPTRTAPAASMRRTSAAPRARGMRIATGKNLMDRNCPEALRDTPQSGYDQSKALIDAWHGRGRLTYAVTPRFAVTSTPEQLEAAGALWRAHPTTLMQTHMSENLAEIRWVAELYPEAPDHLGAYEAFGLIGEGANFGHCIHLTAREIARQLRGYSLHPAKAYWLATMGSAGALRIDDRVGNLAPGYEADVVVIDLLSTPLIRRRMRTVNDLFEALFVQMILADDRAIRATYVAGRKLHDRDAKAA